MDSFLRDVGLFAILYVIVYGYRKIQNAEELKRLGFREDERIYRAADEFARGTPSSSVKITVAGCLDLTEADAEKILLKATPHRADRDGGYAAFLRSVNHVLGAEVYNERRRRHSA